MRPEPLEVLAERLVVGVVWVVLDDGDDGSRVDEAREIVHVAVGVVALDAVAQPEDVSHAEIVPEMALDLARLELRIAVGVEQA